MHMKKTYTIVYNEYCGAQALKSEVIDFLKNHDFVQVTTNPQFCIVIGGDGTFLKAVHEMWGSLSHTIFVPISGGAVNFYSTFNYASLKVLFGFLGDLNNLHTKEYDLLEALFNKDQKAFAINEIKVVDNIKTMVTKIDINHQTLEHFRGSGLVFATASGTTGYMRSVNGAIILSAQPLWEMKEIAPVANAKFSTINSPVILDDSQVISLVGGLIGRQIVLDTFYIDLQDDKLEIKISDLKCKVLFNPADSESLTCRLKQIFSLNGEHLA